MVVAAKYYIVYMWFFFFIFRVFLSAKITISILGVEWIPELERIIDLIRSYIICKICKNMMKFIMGNAVFCLWSVNKMETRLLFKYCVQHSYMEMVTFGMYLTRKCEKCKYVFWVKFSWQKIDHRKLKIYYDGPKRTPWIPDIVSDQ